MRKPIEHYTQTSITRAIKAVQKAGIEIRTIRIEPNGTVVINGENGVAAEMDTLNDWRATV